MNNQRGAALLTVLLLTATVAVVAVGMTELMARAYSRTVASEMRDQAFWALRGIELAALSYIDEQGDDLDQASETLFAEPIELIYEDGLATIRFSERTQCFNLNDLVEDSGEALIPDEAAAERFAKLVTSLGGNQTAGQQMAARIADFIDSDRRAQAGSAEDYDYQRRPVPYRTGGTLMKSVTELRVVQGFSRDVYRSLLPYVCALPSDKPLTLNINTMTERDAPMLVSATGDALNLSAAERLIEARPEEGYENVQEFLGEPLLTNTDLPKDLSTYLSTSSGLLSMEVTLQSGTGRLRQNTLVWRGDGGAQVVERSVGERLP